MYFLSHIRDFNVLKVIYINVSIKRIYFSPFEWLIVWV